MRRRVFLLVLLAVVVADQASKLLVLRGLPQNASLALLDGFFQLVHVRNTGAAFGLLAGFSRATSTLLFTVAYGVAVLVFVHLYRRGGEQAITAVSLALMLGGATGNMVDRLLYGEVIDFLDVSIGRYHWPAFNLGDSCLVVGVALYALGYRAGEGRTGADG
ncbi:MAG: signal peptidase II [Candidatus Tectomicrobia bacterium]|nr:signal peptidase II [Candidatus Tectomicrobia bacterium]